MKIFVVGATGAVGLPLVRALCALGHQVTGMTRAGPGLDHLRELGAEASTADGFDPKAVRAARRLCEEPGRRSTMDQAFEADAGGRTKTFPTISRAKIKRVVLGLGLASAVAVVGEIGYRYWTVGRYLESTDDAYLKADYTTVAPKVSGYIVEVLVEDNQHVEAGQALARIDDRDFKTALDQTRAELEAAGAAIRNLDARIVLQDSVIDQQKAEIAAAEASLDFARKEHARYSDLKETGDGSARRAQQADAALAEKSAQLRGARAALVAARNKVDALRTERGKAIAQRDRGRAAERQAELNLSYTTIVAPVSGTVGDRSLRVGQFVDAGTQLMAIVPPQVSTWSRTSRRGS